MSLRRKAPLRRTPLRPGAPLARGGPIARGKGVRKANPERQASEFKRAYHSKARKKFVSRLPCAACGYAGHVPRDNAHIPDPSASGSRKADYTAIIPLCTIFAVSSGALNCHGRQHGPNGGWSAIGLTEEGRRRAAAYTESAWLEHLAARGGEFDDG